MTHRRLHVSLAALTVLITLALAAPVFAAAPEEPLTQAATGVSATEATLHGVLNPGAPGEAGEYDFPYAQSPGECSQGNSAPQPAGAAAGAEKEAISTTVNGLIPSTEYTFCARATHEGEQSVGKPETFKTESSAPAVESESVSSVTPFAGNLEAQVNPENQATTACRFEYGALTVSEKTVPCNPEELQGFGGQGTSAPLTGLSPATTYRYRVVVENATGTTEGPEQEFSTLALEAPIVGSESVSGVSSTAATLHAGVNPNYQEATYSFEYATNEALTGAVTVNGANPLPAEFAEVPVSVPTGALSPRTVYFYRVAATNASGTSLGPVEHFTTGGTPILTTAAAQSLTRTSASLSGTVDPGGEATVYHYAYATEADFQPLAANPYVKGGVTSQSSLPETDFAAHAAVPAVAIELRPGTTYHYALVASNPAGGTVGPDVTFTTAPPTPPLAVTGAASGVTQTSATLAGSVDARELPAVFLFEFGTVPGAGSLVPASTSPGAGSTEALSVSFSGNLQPGTTYWFRTVASNVDGTAYGAEVSFTTGVFPGQAAPAAAVLVGWPGFVLRELAEGPPKPGVVTPSLTNRQRLAKALRLCGRKAKRSRAACRRHAKRRYG